MKHTVRALGIIICVATIQVASLKAFGLAHAQTIPVLSDCTEDLAKELDWVVPPIPTELRRRSISAASEWARGQCYLPCDYEMCGGIQEYSKTSVTVYVTFRPAPKPKEFVIGPEASVTFQLPDFAVTDEKFFHSGCRTPPPECKLRH